MVIAVFDTPFLYLSKHIGAKTGILLEKEEEELQDHEAEKKKTGASEVAV